MNDPMKVLGWNQLTPEQKTRTSLSLLWKINPHRFDNQPSERHTQQETLTIAEAQLLADVQTERKANAES